MSSEIVVAGTGLAALLTSRALSRAAICHRLLGPVPGSGPRLGDSLSAAASFEIYDRHPDLHPFLVEKDYGFVFFGHKYGVCDFRRFGRPGAKQVLRSFGYANTPGRLFHVRRIELDRYLYEQAANSTHCRPDQDSLADLVFEKATDRVQSVTTTAGEEIAADYVFDCSSRDEAVGRAAGIKRAVLSPRQRVVFWHQTSPDACDAQQVPTITPFDKSVAVVRLDEGADRLAGWAWYIPLGTDRASLGMTTPATGRFGTIDSSEVRSRVCAGFERRGIPVCSNYPMASEAISGEFDNFLYERPCGENWALVGPACLQTWWMSAGGIDQVLIATRLVEPLVQGDARAQATYRTAIERSSGQHAGWEWATNLESSELPVADAYRRLSESFSADFAAVADASGPRNRLATSLAVKAVNAAVHVDSAKAFCAIRHSQLRDGAGQEIESRVRRNIETLTALADAFCDPAVRLPGPVADLIDEGIICHVGPLLWRGRTAWAWWANLAKSQADTIELDIREWQASMTGSTLRGVGVFHTQYGSSEHRSEEVALSFRFSDAGRIVELWTKPSDYDAFRPRLGFDGLQHLIRVTRDGVQDFDAIAMAREAARPDRRALATILRWPISTIGRAVRSHPLDLPVDSSERDRESAQGQVRQTIPTT